MWVWGGMSFRSGPCSRCTPFMTDTKRWGNGVGVEDCYEKWGVKLSGLTTKNT